MKAAVLFEAGSPLVIEELEIDEPKAGEVLVRIGATGVCHSDWHFINGEWQCPKPVVLGHEASGVVAAVGPGVTAVQPGDHAILSFRPNCGRCFFCTSGRPVLCNGWPPAWEGMHDGTKRLHLRGQDVVTMGRVGSFAEYAVVPAEQVVPIRKDVPLEIAAVVGCAVATGVGAVINAAKVEPGSSVVVIGCGGVGLNVILGARLVSAGRIIAVDLLDNKLEYARSFGATHTINASQEDAVKAVRALTGGLGADYAFEAIGRAATIEQAFDCVRPGGVAVVVGMMPHGAKASFNGYLMAFQEKTIKGTLYGSIRPTIDLPRLLELYMAGKLPLDRLITRRYRLEEINEGFDRLARGEVARGVVTFPL
jgi:S-(hydroxymethyl)glutathione dehydrogenase/alcohol dehydrogenase